MARSVKRRKPYATILAAVVVLVYYFANGGSLSQRAPREVPSSPPAALQLVDGAMLEGGGVVTRLLPDDRDGSRHQRLILRLANGQTVLIAHNIDLAPRVEALAVGDTLRFRGQYERNERGGVVHWTHHDPRGEHAGGWLEHHGKRYQ